MASTTYLNLTKLVAGQASAEVTVNTALTALDEEHDRAETLVLEDDFTGGIDTSSSPFLTAVSGAGASVANTGYTGEQNHVGVAVLSTGTTTTGYASVHTASAALLRLGGGAWRARAIFRLEDLSDGTNTYTLRLGLGDSQVAGEPTDGCYIRYTHGTNSGKFEFVTRSNGTETATDTTVTAAADTWYRVEIIGNSDSTSVACWIKEGTDDLTLRATNTTNIPTAAGRETAVQASVIKSAGTTARTCYLDVLALRVAFTTAR